MLDRLGDDYEAVIGLEVHCQLATDSKLFSRAPTQFGAPPNTQVAPVDMGLPGALPVLNRRAVEFAIRAGLALNADIRRRSRFARKNYFYPDLPKGYQISQHALPLCEGGHLEVEPDEGPSRRVGIDHVHLEEDAGKSQHLEGREESLVDLNRCGVPLIEIVSDPDLRTPSQARAYMKQLRDIVVYLGISDGDMSEGSMRCDANVSVRPVGAERHGTRTELKNINSFKFVHDGIAHEIERQIDVLESGGEVEQQTRLYDPDADETRVMRTKEESHDYRYFPEPDLPPLVVDDDWLEAVRRSLPELPSEKRARYREDFGLGDYEAGVLTAERPRAEFFETVLDHYEGSPDEAANWIINELLRVLNESEVDIESGRLSAAEFAEVLEMVDSERISQNAGKDVLAEMVETGDDPETIVEREGLEQVSDESALEGVVDEIVEDHPEQVEEYRSGKDQVLGWFIGQIMQATQGKANPKVARELLTDRLDD
jgi:aspartyl-tRNA(Asn)/glutamyl-tRNA(Gln) amidotransferase subunit B